MNPPRTHDKAVAIRTFSEFAFADAMNARRPATDSVTSNSERIEIRGRVKVLQPGTAGEMGDGLLISNF